MAIEVSRWSLVHKSTGACFAPVRDSWIRVTFISYPFFIWLLLNKMWLTSKHLIPDSCDDTRSVFLCRSGMRAVSHGQLGIRLLRRPFERKRRSVTVAFTDCSRERCTSPYILHVCCLRWIQLCVVQWFLITNLDFNTLPILWYLGLGNDTWPSSDCAPVTGTDFVLSFSEPLYCACVLPVCRIPWALKPTVECELFPVRAVTHWESVWSCLDAAWWDVAEQLG